MAQAKLEGQVRHFYCLLHLCMLLFQKLISKIQFSKNHGANCRHSRFEPAMKAQWWENTSSEYKRIWNFFKLNSRKPETLKSELKSNFSPKARQSPFGPSEESVASAKRRSPLRWGDSLFKETTSLQWPTYFAFNAKSWFISLVGATNRLPPVSSTILQLAE